MSAPTNAKYAWLIVGDGGELVPEWLCPYGHSRILVAYPPHDSNIFIQLKEPVSLSAEEYRTLSAEFKARQEGIVA